MDRAEARKLLEGVRRGRLSVEQAMRRLRDLSTADLGFASLDLHRAVRRGHPEAVYGAGKTPEQIEAIVRRLAEAGQTALVTRAAPEAFEAVKRSTADAAYHEQARAIFVRRGRAGRARPGIVVVTAGTSDIQVAEEAILTAELMGQAPVRLYDVGVAGLHRLLAHRETLLDARVVVVAAGMEGALPSVVAGLVDCPVIGVPTSAGYGTGTGGFAALLAMLNSCAAGLAVVNIDNGYGAGYLASVINASRGKR